MKSLQTEIAEMLEAIGSDNGNWSNWANTVLRESVDVLAHFLDAVDDENQAAELSSLKREIVAMAEAAINKAGVKPPRMLRPFIGPMVKAGVEWAVDEIVDSGQTADQWCKTELVPLLKELDETLLHWTMVLTRKDGG